MPARMRIIVGFDGSADSWTAARYAVAEAATGHGLVRLMHSVLDRVTYTTLLPPDWTADVQAEAQRLVAAARDELARAAPGVDVQTTIVQRAPSAALVRVSRSADLIVLGRHGHGRPPAGGGFQLVHVGAVATHVMTYASCPVVVAGPGDADARGPVVLGLDAAAPSPAATSYAFEVAQRRGAGVRVCYIGAPDDPRDDADARLLLSQALAGWRAAFADVPVALDVLHGIDPAARLLDAAAGAALVVVGARVQGGAPRGGADAVPDTLTRNATCPVAVVRPHRRVAARPAAVAARPVQ